MTKSRKWRITLTEEQLCVLTSAIEDWHRFICGQCSMDHATSFIDAPRNMRVVRELLDKHVKPVMFPELHLNAAYSWDGGQPNPHMSKAAAISYAIYREALHQMTLADHPDGTSCYLSPTLRCDEQGPMIKVERIKE